uniref:Uncharacterized protein n=1 Tax=Arundo donax TaxID=35708 RepID=A0A0A9DB00_ARUDO
MPNGGALPNLTAVGAEKAWADIPCTPLPGCAMPTQSAAAAETLGGGCQDGLCSAALMARADATPVSSSVKDAACVEVLATVTSLSRAPPRLSERESESSDPLLVSDVLLPADLLPCSSFTLPAASGSGTAAKAAGSSSGSFSMAAEAALMSHSMALLGWS